MIKRTFCCIAISFAILSISTLYGVDVVYTEGYVDARYTDGELVELQIGDIVENGDTVLTGKDGRADLEPARGSLIRISPDTVFTVRQIERDGEKRNVLATTVGAVRFKFDRLTGQEPLIATPGMVAGVRGTELEVFASSDGAVIILVSTGAVEVESRGESVALGENEGVEVEPGKPPGEKFEVLRGQLDFSSWNGEREAALLEDPIKSLEGAAIGLDSLIEELELLIPTFEEKRESLDLEREKLRDEEDADKRKSAYEQIVYPLEVETSYLALNIRYFALSALSYRRFILGTMYLRIKVRDLEETLAQGTSAPGYDDFYRLYEAVIERFERAVTPHLVEIDI